MNRRNFFNSLIGGVATAAAVRTFPFRVFSFPSEVVAPPFLTRMDMLLAFAEFDSAPRIGRVIHVKTPPRWDSPTVLVGREVAIVKSYDVQGGIIMIDIPGRSEKPLAAFTGYSASSDNCS